MNTKVPPPSVEEQTTGIQEMVEKVAADAAARHPGVEYTLSFTLNQPLYEHLQSLPREMLPAYATTYKLKVNPHLLPGMNDISLTTLPPKEKD